MEAKLAKLSRLGLDVERMESGRDPFTEIEVEIVYNKGAREDVLRLLGELLPNFLIETNH